VFRERSGEKGKPFIVDAGGYREKHVQKLQALAARMGEKALKTGTIVELSPMSPHDRRIVHMAISAIPGLSTRSEGEGDDRHILVVPSEQAVTTAE
jgi:spoIIIJ-associated protein